MNDNAQNRAQNRAAPRSKVFEPADMTIGDRHRRVHILNISTTGALVHGDCPPGVGQSLALRCAALAADGRVAWVAGNRFGVAFDPSLSDAELAAAIAPTRAVPILEAVRCRPAGGNLR